MYAYVCMYTYITFPHRRLLIHRRRPALVFIIVLIVCIAVRRNCFLVCLWVWDSLLHTYGHIYV